MTNGKMMTPKQQASNFKSIMKSNIKLHNKTLKEQAKIVRRAEKAQAGGIDWVSSIGWSVALTAAVNPTYTMEKLKEAERAIKRELKL
jgi:biotin synthase-like enzyme